MCPSPAVDFVSSLLDLQGGACQSFEICATFKTVKPMGVLLVQPKCAAQLGHQCLKKGGYHVLATSKCTAFV